MHSKVYFLLLMCCADEFYNTKHHSKPLNSSRVWTEFHHIIQSEANLDPRCADNDTSGEELEKKGFLENQP